MRPCRSLALVLLALAACTTDDPVAVGGGGQPVDVVLDTMPAPAAPVASAPAARTLVMLNDGPEPVLDVARALLADRAPDAGARRDSIRPLLASRGFTVPLTPQEVAAVAGDERVEYAELPRPVTVDRAVATPVTATPVTAPAGVGVFGQHTGVLAWVAAPSWALDRITQRALPLDGAAAFTGTGEGVTIYVIDTGVRLTHAEYAGRVSSGPDYIDGGIVTGDCNGHGTKVASDAAGLTMGTARRANVVAVRVLDCAGRGSSVEVVEGIDWVIAQVRARPGPAVINMSLGISGVCAPVNQATARATQAGIVVVAAAGNSNANACTFSPASEPSAITVGATDATDARASFSNWGTCVDLYAPGANVDGADASGDRAYAPWSGTSAASPYVAGVAALYLQQYPTATPAQVSVALNAGATPSVVRGTNVAPNRLVYLPADGSQASPGAPGSPGGSPGTFVAPPTARAVITCARRTCTFDGSTSSDAEGIAKWAWTYGNGKKGTTATGTQKFTTDGTYVARLTVTNLRGLAATRDDTVRVADAPPVARATAVCTGWSCRFDASRSTDDGTVSRYSWTFGDGGASASPNSASTRVYQAAGTYTATLVVTDDVGQTSRVQVTATTTPRPPVPSVKVTCRDRVCAFDATGSRDDRGIDTYTWDFLDGTLQTGVRVTKSYASGGAKRFRLTVRNTSGLTTTVQGTITVR